MPYLFCPLLFALCLPGCAPFDGAKQSSPTRTSQAQRPAPADSAGLELGVSAYAPGVISTYVATGGIPGDEVYLLHGPNASPRGLCPDILAPACLGLEAPVWVAGNGTFDAAGNAVLNYTLPATRTDLIGRDAHIQAVSFDSVLALSPVVTRTIQSAPCTDEDLDGLCDPETLDWETECSDAIVDGVELCFALVADVDERPDITTIYYMTTVPIIGWQLDATDGLFSGVSRDVAGDLRVFADGSVALGISLTLTPIEPGTGVLARLGWDVLSETTSLSALAVLEDATEAASLIANDGRVVF